MSTSLCEQTYFTKAEAAAYLRCSIRFLDARIATGELTALRLHRKILFTRNDLDKLLQQRSATFAALGE